LFFEKITTEKTPNNSDPMQFYPKYAVKPYQYPGYIAIHFIKRFSNRFPKNPVRLSGRLNPAASAAL
jgi:hypothetical protein